MRNYYRLPPVLGSFAVEKYKKAKEVAIKEKKAILDREGAIALLRQETHAEGLIYVSPTDRSGFTVPRQYGEYYLIKPKKNTLIGRRIQAELDEVCKLLDEWQWATEKALNLEESVYEHREFHLTVAIPMPDGSVLVSQHKDAKHKISEEYKITAQVFKEEKEKAL